MEFQQDSGVTPDATMSQHWSSAFHNRSTIFGRAILHLGNQEGSFMIFAYFVGLCCLLRYLQVRQEREKQGKLLRDYERRCETEKNAIGKLIRGSERQSASESVHVPRRPRSGQKTAVHQEGAFQSCSGTQLSSGGAAASKEHFASLSMSPIGKEFRSNLLRKILKNRVGPRNAKQDLVYLRGSEGHTLQTQIEMSGDVTTMLHEVAVEAVRSNKNFRLQLGMFQLYTKSPYDDKVELLKLKQTDPVPVILHASYVAGFVTIYGLHLTGAKLMVATSNKCRVLVTKCQKGAGNLEIHTACLDTLPWHKVRKVMVYATKNIIVEECEVCVTSSAIFLQDDNLKAVFRIIFPISIFLIYLANHTILFMEQIMEATMEAIKPFQTFVWIFVPLLVIILPNAFSKSAKTIVRNLWDDLHERVYSTLYVPGLSFPRPNETMHCDRWNFEEDIYGIIDNGFDNNCKRKSHINSKIMFDHEGGHKFEESCTPIFDDDCEQTNVHARNINWQWPIYDIVYENTTDIHGHIENTKNSDVLRSASALERENTKANVPFEVIYDCYQNVWATQVTLRIFSPSLMKVIEHLIPNEVDRWIKSPMTIACTKLFFIHQELIQSSSGFLCNVDELLHLNHMLHFLDQELHDIEEMFETMKTQRRLSFDMLWAFFPPGEIIVYPCKITNAEICGKVEQVNYISDNYLYFEISLSKWDYNCQTWVKSSTTHEILSFQGHLAFDSMEIYPIHLKGDRKGLENKFFKLGSLFCELSMLQQSNFKNYKGVMFTEESCPPFISGRYEQCTFIQKENADGRVMIDLRSFAKMDPDYNFGTARPPYQLLLYDYADNTIDISKNGNRMFAPAFVYGFSFRLKKWGCFSISGFSDIVFDTDAYEMLIMDEGTKELTESMVHEHLNIQVMDSTLRRAIFQLDPIAAKGEGCIFLCYGPPGTSKTLTVESLSEKLRRPLWSLSLSELGTTPKDLESTLMRIMDVAYQWGAILLMDEANIYLERRTSSDLTRNAMTGIIMRYFEYYRGVLFLTTNRDFVFDEALCSRTSMFLFYENLNEKQRRLIWINILKRSGIEEYPSSDVISEFVEYEFNGREIRNAMQAAQTLASSKDEPFNAKHITKALIVLQSAVKQRLSCNSKIEFK